MKKLIALLMCFILLMSVFCAYAETPKTIPVLSEDEIPDTPDGVHNYLLLCVDSWDAKPNNLGNTDGMVLVTVDEYAHRLMLTSFIRDLLIQRTDDPADGFNRLSRFVPQNGHNQEAVEKLIKIYGTHFGVKIDHYVVIDWTMIRNIIDAVGGVDITVTAGEATRLKSKDAYKSSWTTPVLSGAGTYHFTGYAAVIYMRIRSSTVVNGEANDFRRTTRARSVLTSIATSLSDITYDQALNLLDAVVENMLLTDMSTMDMLEAVNLAYKAKDWDIEQMRIPIKGTYEGITYTGGSCQQIDFIKNREALNDFLYGGFIVTEMDDEDEELDPLFDFDF